MAKNPFMTRFIVGKTYKLRTSASLPKMLAGTMTVKAEIRPSDVWGNRVLLCDVTLDNPPNGMPSVFHSGRCFVEEGYTEIENSYGSRTVAVEIAALQGIYPYFAKAYAIDGFSRMSYSSMLGMEKV